MILASSVSLIATKITIMSKVFPGFRITGVTEFIWLPLMFIEISEAKEEKLDALAILTTNSADKRALKPLRRCFPTFMFFYSE